jgi:MOSC domain-containing protein YiiM
MTAGTVVELYVAPAKAADLAAVGEVVAVEGQGLAGDRYFGADGAGRNVTLVEAEAIAAVAADREEAVGPQHVRRNIVTTGVALNHLVGRRFRVGEVVLEGVRLCEPCRIVEELVGDGGRMAFLHRAGLRADVVRGGVIRVGDQLGPAD